MRLAAVARIALGRLLGALCCLAEWSNRRRSALATEFSERQLAPGCLFLSAGGRFLAAAGADLAATALASCRTRLLAVAPACCCCCRSGWHWSSCGKRVRWLCWRSWRRLAGGHRRLFCRAPLWQTQAGAQYQPGQDLGRGDRWWRRGLAYGLLLSSRCRWCWREICLLLLWLVAADGDQHPRRPLRVAAQAPGGPEGQQQRVAGPWGSA
jgi:hypothetical protein